MGEPDLKDLPDWVKALGLPPEAVAAIDRYWKPVWEKLSLLPRHHAPGEELELEAIEEERPGPLWQARYEAMWPAYRAWYLQEGDAARPRYRECRDALARHMPELVPTYERLVELAGGGDLAARLLSLWRPPGFIVGCSQGVWTRGDPMLVRNYDYPASRLEGIVYLTRWGERRVIGMSDCLWGLLDGVNDAGLAVSLTFGGRPDVGEGFAISLVVRYLLETCDTVDQARAALERVPVHAPQNLTLLDRSGAHVTAYVGPDRPVRFVDTPATTNHQGARRVAGVRARDPHRGARALRARPARRRAADARPLRRRVPRAAAPQHAVQGGLRDDLHGRLPPRERPRGLSLARRGAVGAVVRRLLARQPDGGAA